MVIFCANKGVVFGMFMGLECVCNLVDFFVQSHCAKTFGVRIQACR